MNSRLSILILFLWGMSIPASACQCDSIPSFDSAYQASGVVFSGKVLEVATNWVSSGLKITFQVNQSWKTPLEAYFTINTDTERNCGYPFKAGAEYLVYADKKFAWKTDVCSRTRLLSQAENDLSRLGAGIEPGSSDDHLKMMWLVTGLVAASMLGLGLIVFLRRKKK